MAQLKDSIVSGSLRVTDTLYTTTQYLKTLYAPSSSGSSVYGTGTSGQVLKSDGTYVYWGTDNNTGTVTSVQVQATSPVVSSTSTAQTSTLNTTISLSNGYGDTKNPYASKTANFVLAAPNGSNGVPTFRALVAADIPSLSYLPLSGGTLTGDLILDDHTLRVNTTSGAAINYRYLGSDSSNTLGIVYNVSAYSNQAGTRQTKETSQAGFAIFKVPMIKNNVMGPCKFAWYQKSVDSSLNPTSYFEIYSLPDTTNSLTENKTYDILTTKTAITIAQGGTGATDAAGARTNLGLGTMATQTATNYIAKSIGTAAGDLLCWTAASTPARLAKGTVGQMLQVTSNGVAWGPSSRAEVVDLT